MTGRAVTRSTPERREVYAAAELFAGFDPARPESYGETPDFASFRWFVGDRARHSDGCR